MCTPYFAKFNFVYVRSQQKRTEKVISSYHIYSVTVLSLLDDAYTCRWRGSQQTGPVRTTRRSDARTARRRPRNK